MTVKEGDVNSPVRVGVLKFDNVSLMKQIGIEDDRPVLPVRNGDRFGSAFLQKRLNFLFVFLIIIRGKVLVIA